MSERRGPRQSAAHTLELYDNVTPKMRGNAAADRGLGEGPFGSQIWQSANSPAGHSLDLALDRRVKVTNVTGGHGR